MPICCDSTRKAILLKQCTVGLIIKDIVKVKRSAIETMNFVEDTDKLVLLCTHCIFILVCIYIIYNDLFNASWVPVLLS